MKMLIISGRSGSGKSVVLQTLEDLQYYCVDNLPLPLLPLLHNQLQPYYSKMAVSIDCRNIRQSEEELSNIIKDLQAKVNCDIVYLDANDDVLIQRFKETRRRHPLTASDTSLREALQQEHTLLSPILEHSDLKIDTGSLTPQRLRNLTLEYIEKKDSNNLSILIESFGYKYGIPNEADFIFDVRCLPNPYWNNKLRHQSGLAPEVMAYLDKQKNCQEVLADVLSFLLKWLPAYRAEQRKYLTIAIGCTGGMHRSVYLAHKLTEELQKTENNVSLRHREL